MNLLSTIALAKFTSILTCALVIYFGIKRLKSGKYLFACVALIPSCMLLGTSFSYDYWVTAFIIYAYACFVSELQKKDEKISSETIFLMLSAMILGCGPKMIYFALVFPMLFIGKHKFETKKDKNRYSLLCLGALLFVFVSFALPFFLNVGGSTDIRGGADVNSGEQFIFIFSNPFKYAGILIRFMCDYVALDDMTAQVINFSYMGTPNIIYGTIVVLLILFTAFVDKSEDLYPGRTRLALISFATCFAQIALVATALYISFTPVGHGTVNGCQYRYLFPVMIPFFYFLGSGKVKCNAKPAVLNTVIFSLITLTLFMSYYGVYLSRMN